MKSALVLKLAIEETGEKIARGAEHVCKRDSESGSFEHI
jgi:hypothetical protein